MIRPLKFGELEYQTPLSRRTGRSLLNWFGTTELLNYSGFTKNGKFIRVYEVSATSLSGTKAIKLSSKVNAEEYRETLTRDFNDFRTQCINQLMT